MADTLAPHDCRHATSLSTAALELKLKELQEEARDHSQVLTKKLSSSQSGQNLLHIGSSLSTLPPDLHSLLTTVHPLHTSIENSESAQLQSLRKLVVQANRMRERNQRVQKAYACSELYTDLVSAEMLLSDAQSSAHAGGPEALPSTLERVAHIAKCLTNELVIANESISILASSTESTPSDSVLQIPKVGANNDHDTEMAEFVIKLSGRIYKLESTVYTLLCERFESELHNLQKVSASGESLRFLGQCMRGLALLGKGKDVESIFARAAVMPIVRSLISMGRLDQGGGRGECKGLVSLLDELALAIKEQYGPVLRLGEEFFVEMNQACPDIDLLANGTWLPIATAMLSDAGVKMAIFSPGIASVLQSNYLAVNSFTTVIASKLLDVGKEKTAASQERIAAHEMTKEFSKKWNLPIYYQLRFGEGCKRLNSIIDETQVKGWSVTLARGDRQERDNPGFELAVFIELHSILTWLWKSDVILMPLANRFLRGAIQLVGRTLAFVDGGLDGTIQFGERDVDTPTENVGESLPPSQLRCWCENEFEVATVAWELHILQGFLTSAYPSIILTRLAFPDNVMQELSTHSKETLNETSNAVDQSIQKAWKVVVVGILTRKCCEPLAAVKGIAATYRMTNRPPPAQPSVFVASITRPMKDFSSAFNAKVPTTVGRDWKLKVLEQVASEYTVAVEQLIATVERTEVALQRQNNRVRRARVVASGGLSDGEKVKLQLHLDCVAFERDLADLDVNPTEIPSFLTLKELTKK